MKILIEGLDLAGKSTACRAILDELDPRPAFQRNALTPANAPYLLADELRKKGNASGQVLGYLYMAAVEQDLACPQPGGNVLQDSTVALRSLAHYRARDLHGMAEPFARLLADARFPRFDRAIVLVASVEARLARLEKRQREEPGEVAEDDLLVVKNPALFMRMEAVLAEAAVAHFDAAVIDTSHLTPLEVKLAVLGAVQGGEGGR